MLRRKELRGRPVSRSRHQLQHDVLEELRANLHVLPLWSTPTGSSGSGTAARSPAMSGGSTIYTGRSRLDGRCECSGRSYRKGGSLRPATSGHWVPLAELLHSGRSAVPVSCPPAYSRYLSRNRATHGNFDSGVPRLQQIPTSSSCAVLRRYQHSKRKAR